MKDLKATTKTLPEAVDKKNRFNFKRCGTITCIHNIGEKCNLKICDMYERTFKQEY